jgi:transcriptional regulator with XRE-family HTH domain|tara:strand:+ start:67 stop:474 length:408 start_codon:yes stop_codon:yes gene_type:complete
LKKNKDYYSDWGSEDLKQFRSKLGVTQAVMSEKLGLSSRMYRYYESGNMKISKYLEYAVRWIVEKSNLSRETKKELENLSNFDKERITKLRDAIESLVINGSESYPKGGKEWDNDYIRRVLSQTLKEFDIVLSKN